MRDVAIIGIGQTPVGEHWEKSLRHLAHDAIMAAMRDASIEAAEALYVGNMLSGALNGQEHLGALIADFVGLRGIEAMKVEAACGSGAAAVRVGAMAIASGMHELVLVCGIEKMSDAIGNLTTGALATAADQEYEVSQGISFVGLNALLMRRYMHEYDVAKEAFAGFTVNAHRNGAHNPNAMFRSPVSEAAYARAGMIADPINLLDSSPVCDGAACLVLAPADRYRSRAKALILASAVAIDSLAIHDRRDPLVLDAAVISSQKAYAEARLTPANIQFFEAHDAFSIMSALSLEAAGFAPRGAGVRLAQDGEIAIGGHIPLSTMGGLKARGHPVGATGVYQIVEAVQQLTGQAGQNQVAGATIGMAQNIGGSGATVVTHILGAV
ncbi:MAG: thiolase domain-containing protein [Anaerolineae bacterium]|jgi:acetyl-CoA C-acetyltransferase|nr:thiolase domain-containing protein [Anaerolineae bacterium]